MRGRRRVGECDSYRRVTSESGRDSRCNAAGIDPRACRRRESDSRSISNEGGAPRTRWSTSLRRALRTGSPVAAERDSTPLLAFCATAVPTVFVGGHRTHPNPFRSRTCRQVVAVDANVATNAVVHCTTLHDGLTRDGTYVEPAVRHRLIAVEEFYHPASPRRSTRPGERRSGRGDRDDAPEAHAACPRRGAAAERGPD
jgi:hypothetical protein